MMLHLSVSIKLSRGQTKQWVPCFNKEQQRTPSVDLRSHRLNEPCTIPYKSSTPSTIIHCNQILYSQYCTTAAMHVRQILPFNFLQPSSHSARPHDKTWVCDMIFPGPPRRGGIYASMDHGGDDLQSVAAATRGGAFTSILSTTWLLRGFVSGRRQLIWCLDMVLTPVPPSCRRRTRGGRPGSPCTGR